LNQAAQTAKRSPQFAATHSSIAQRRGKKIATIAISRKLLARAYHLLAGMQATDTTTPPGRTAGIRLMSGIQMEHSVALANRQRESRNYPSTATVTTRSRSPPHRYRASWRSLTVGP
jgi:hypothetical protein